MATNHSAPVPVEKVPTFSPTLQSIYCWHASCLGNETGTIFSKAIGTILAGIIGMILAYV